ncbi:flagellin [Roseibium aquae]|uniref:Flagellin n=1 Tax=Roseibium aquae TaxID=1323746 RepID=A0A916WW66_9HYPH|nr:flagellin [Roseibium aquae]GGB37305.1 flagellin [Roseibium aquae]
MSDITLSAAVRQNLLTLQTTADLLSDVQGKLATGLKVNSALDNPNSFFTASGLNSRANDLNNLLDDMGQSLQTLKAADKGIQSITKLVDSAKAKANQALQTQSQFERAQFAKQYNDLLEQIEDLAKDSSYKGKNLLAGGTNDLTTIFNEDATSKLTIQAVDYTDASLSTGLNLSDIAEAQGGASSFDIRGGSETIALQAGTGQPLQSSSLLSASDAIDVDDVLALFDGPATASSIGTGFTVGAGTTVQDLVNYIDGFAGVNASFDDATGQLVINSNQTIDIRNDGSSGSTGNTADLAAITASAANSSGALLTNSASFKVGDTLTLTDGNNFELGSIEIEADTTIEDLINFLDDFNGVTASFEEASGRISLLSDTDLTLASDNNDFNDNTVAATNTNNDVTIAALTDSGFATDGQINRVIDRLNTALGNLRSQASEFGTNLSTIEIRQDYTRSLINTLQEGAGLLTLADTNEEGANLLALQTRQQLAATSLSFASQADQTVLSLF